MTLKPVKPETPATPAQASAANLVAPNATRSTGCHAMLTHLARLWPISAKRIELAAVFAEADDNKGAVSPLVKRIDAALSNMVKTGHASCRGSGKDRQWMLGPAAKLVGPMGPHQTEPEPDLPAYVGECVPARQPDTMTGPNYCPQPMQALRPGSGDFTRLPSLRQGQRLPFTGGYVAMSAET